MELHAVDPTLVVAERRRRRIGRRREHDGALGRTGDRVEVTHPDRLLGRRLGEERTGLGDGEFGAAVLAPTGLGDFAAEIAGDQLRAVTEPEDRHSGVVDRRVDRRRVGGMDGRRTAREDDRRGPPRQHLGDRHRTRHDLGVHVRFPHAPGDQLRVLRPEVDDENEFVHLLPMPTPCERCSSFPSVCNDGATITSAFWNSLSDS